MSNRLDISSIEPDAFKTMLGFETYLAGTKLSRTHKNLIKIRASQINGCAYCIDMHTKDARQAGETEQRLYGLMAWQHAPFFSEEEKAILALTEELTLVSQRVADKTFQHAATLLTEEYLAQVIMTIISINSWNRFSIAAGIQPPVQP